MSNEGGKTLAQVAQRGGGCPIPADIPGQAGCGSGHSDLVEGVPAHCRGLDWMSFGCPFQPKLFHDSVTSQRRGWRYRAGPSLPAHGPLSSATVLQ